MSINPRKTYTRKELTAEFTKLIADEAFTAPNHDPNCKRQHLLLRYAFIQRGFGFTPDAHFWHVLTPGPSFHSTLSIKGLHDWGLIRRAYLEDMPEGWQGDVTVPEKREAI